MAVILGLIVPILKLLETLISARSRGLKTNEQATTILRLRSYRKRLETALEARRQSRIEHGLDERDGGLADRLPDDGYRRD